MAPEPPAPTRPTRNDFRCGEKVAFEDKYLQTVVGTIRINSRTATIDPGDGTISGVGFALLRHVLSECIFRLRVTAKGTVISHIPSSGTFPEQDRRLARRLVTVRHQVLEFFSKHRRSRTYGAMKVHVGSALQEQNLPCSQQTIKRSLLLSAGGGAVGFTVGAPAEVASRRISCSFSRSSSRT